MTRCPPTRAVGRTALAVGHNLGRGHPLVPGTKRTICLIRGRGGVVFWVIKSWGLLARSRAKITHCLVAGSCLNSGIQNLFIVAPAFPTLFPTSGQGTIRNDLSQSPPVQPERKGVRVPVSLCSQTRARGLGKFPFGLGELVKKIVPAQFRQPPAEDHPATKSSQVIPPSPVPFPPSPPKIVEVQEDYREGRNFSAPLETGAEIDKTVP